MFWSIDDPESGIYSTAVALGTTAGSADVVSFTAGGQHGLHLQGLSLVQGAMYFITLLATNNAGLMVVANSNVTVDVTPPLCDYNTRGRYEKVQELGISWVCHGECWRHTAP